MGSSGLDDFEYPTPPSSNLSAIEDEDGDDDYTVSSGSTTEEDSIDSITEAENRKRIVDPSTISLFDPIESDNPLDSNDSFPSGEKEESLDGVAITKEINDSTIVDSSEMNGMEQPNFTRFDFSDSSESDCIDYDKFDPSDQIWSVDPSPFLLSTEEYSTHCSDDFDKREEWLLFTQSDDLPFLSQYDDSLNSYLPPFDHNGVDDFNIYDDFEPFSL